MDNQQNVSVEGHSDSDGQFATSRTADTDVEKSVAPGQPKTPGELDPNNPPDGGLEAWTVVLGGFLIIFSSFGWINCEIFDPNHLHGTTRLINHLQASASSKITTNTTS